MMVEPQYGFLSWLCIGEPCVCVIGNVGIGEFPVVPGSLEERPRREGIGFDFGRWSYDSMGQCC